ncbi:MAG: DUF2142 domain-containing protein, partial [Acidimicrobiia bacterium]
MLAGLFGVAYSILSPPFQGPDEHHHLYRAYQVSRGQVVATRIPGGVGGQIPDDIAEVGEMFSELRHRPEEKVSGDQIITNLFDRPGTGGTTQAHFEGAALYSPVPYLPQAIAIRVGRGLGLPPLILMYLGRFADLAMWIALVTIALHVAPIGRWALLVLALTPMSVFIAGTLSVDPVTNGLSIVWDALFLRMRRETRTLSHGE